jgi:hypothetical protein
VAAGTEQRVDRRPRSFGHLGLLQVTREFGEFLELGQVTRAIRALGKVLAHFDLLIGLQLLIVESR